MSSWRPFRISATRGAERAVAGYDVPRKLEWVAVYELPFLRNNRNAMSALLGGWQISITGILQAGNPINVFMTAPWPRGDFNADGFNNDRPHAPGANVPRGGWERSDYQNGIFNISDFPVPATGTDGNLGRNRFRGPGFAQVDLSLAKRFAITERITLQFRADAFNAFNRLDEPEHPAARRGRSGSGIFAFWVSNRGRCTRAQAKRGPHDEQSDRLFVP